jgi:heme A synthase
MKRLLTTRYGFFGFAALICWAMLFVIEAQHRFVAIGLGALYALLSLLFLMDEISRGNAKAPKPPKPGDKD